MSKSTNVIDLDELENLLYRENSIIDPDDVEAFMEVVKDHLNTLGAPS